MLTGSGPAPYPCPGEKVGFTYIAFIEDSVFCYSKASS